jgi:hypothetical protein
MTQATSCGNIFLEFTLIAVTPAAILLPGVNSAGGKLPPVSTTPC